ncbi:MAG: 30S ribosome-binding factor RbfA [Bacteroides sp.]|jgi:ribosome-binding factor A
MEDVGATLRQQKVSRQLQRDFSEMFQNELRALAGGCLISVTDVWISQDLEQAKVYISIFPKEHEQEIFENIQSKGKEIRYQLGKRVRHQLRLVPELLFRLDQSLDEVEKLEGLLAQIKHSES